MINFFSAIKWRGYINKKGGNEVEMNSTAKTNIQFHDFPMDRSQVAPCIYKNLSHQTTNTGIVLNHTIIKELRRFLLEYLQSLAKTFSSYHFYCRIDAYFDENSITILEVNTAFVDGWGTALNLSRTCGIKINPDLLFFPKFFSYCSCDYLPELQLLVDELRYLGKDEHTIASQYDYDKFRIDNIKPVYLYGRTITQTPNENIVFFDGNCSDNKS